MKSILFILFNFLLLFSFGENNTERKEVLKIISRDAVMAQDVQSFFSVNPHSQKRNQPEFWEADYFIPKLKH
jgi:hypothetical protein